MIEQIGVIVSLEPGHAWVKATRRSGCDHCAVASDCGTSKVAQFFNGRSARVRATNPIDAAVGDEVVIGMGSGRLVMGSALIYLIPLLAMLAGGLIGDELAGEGGAVVGAVSGLVASLWFNRLRARSLERRGLYQPRILRRNPSAASMVR